LSDSDQFDDDDLLVNRELSPAAGRPDDDVPAQEPRLNVLRTSALYSLFQAAAAFLRASRLGLVVMALVVGVGGGFGAVGFRELIFFFTWLATGHTQFGQQGRVGSLHLPWMGIWFLLLVPVVGGLLYGPLIQRFAKEARGHGVPEVMLAVAENGGRIRPQVTIVKALASGLCIGSGGSVGREGPIVQIGSAFASTLGQWVRMSETRLRIIVACGAAGGIAATFNAPITGMFFGFEIVLREFSLDALFATILSSVTADLISRAFFGAAPFFSGMPHNLLVAHDYTYLLVAVLGILSGVLGWGFKTILYKLEDLLDLLWKGRPEWARPAVGGLALGLLLLALPQMYGVGYPVMNRVAAGHYVLWFVALLMVGKIAAASLTLAIGGSGGVFAPSLFTGVTAGMAFGVIVTHLFGHIVSSPAIFAVVAMGGVFGAAAQAPLTAIASVVEMTGNFTLILPVMLTTGIASAVSKRLSFGSIYTTKLLRRGIDIERAKPTSVLQTLTVSDVMIALSDRQDHAAALADRDRGEPNQHGSNLEALAEVAGPVVATSPPQVLFSDETLDQALRQLELYGRVGLPVLSPDGQHLRGWVTRHNVLRALADSVSAAAAGAEQGRLATEFATPNAESRLHVPRTPLDGYEIVEVSIASGSPALGKRVDEVQWPTGSLVVAVSQQRELGEPRAGVVLRRGERVVLLVPCGSAPGGTDSPSPGPSLPTTPPFDPSP
jgi:chloride channel protein, CIC family